MQNSGIFVRSASERDWPAIWPILQAVAEAGNTFTYPTDRSEDHGRSLWMGPAGRTIVAVDRAGQLVGTARMSANQMGPGKHIATGSFMVAQSARGRGVGRVLGEAMIDWAKGSGFKGVQFNAVVATNVIALRLWHALGFAIVGTVPGAFAHPEHGDVPLHIMYRVL